MASMVRIDISGLRDLQGRLASFQNYKAVEIQLAEASRTARVVQDIYRTRAPRSRGAGSGIHFYQGLEAQARVSGNGFEITLTTTEPELRRWLGEGTGIYGPTGQVIKPKSAKALGPIFNSIAGPGPNWFRSVKGMKPQPWEDEAEAEAVPFVDQMGSIIGNHMARYISEGY